MLWLCVFGLLIWGTTEAAAKLDTLSEQYEGCSVHTSSHMVHRQQPEYLQDNTIDNCVTYCRGQQYTFALLTYGYACFCGNNYSKTWTWSCWNHFAIKCTGDDTAMCGAEHRDDNKDEAGSVFRVCSPGQYGAECSRVCSQCGGRGCHMNGSCLDECPAGKHGDDCGQECDNSYGPDCKYQCSENKCSNNHCHPINGFCTDGCPWGRYGPFCRAHPPTELNNPSGPCPFCAHCKDSVCAGDGGPVYHECPRNWQGDICKECSDGKWGSRCEETCAENCISCTMGEGSCTQCREGYYGPACSPCPGHCASGVCQQGNGSCSGRCQNGYFRNSCDETCPTNCDQQGCAKQTGDCVYCKPAFHGTQCEKICGKCSGGTCYRDNGTCNACMNGYHGNKCTEPCSRHCNGNVCHQDSGDCTSGCVSGYYLPDCTASCPSGCMGGCNITNGVCASCVSDFYGPQCKGKCPEKCPAGVCLQLTGDCSGCDEGFYGPRCEDKCPAKCLTGVCLQLNGDCSGCDEGFYGPRCENNCPKNCKDRTCEHSTGDCVGCETGFYGKHCSKTCDGCLDGLCNRTTGACTRDCTPGFCGTLCTETCLEKSSVKACDPINCMSKAQTMTTGKPIDVNQADHTPLIAGVAIGGVVLLLAVIGSIILFSMIRRGKVLCCFGKLNRSTSKQAGRFDQPMSLEPTRSAKGNTPNNDLEQQNLATVVVEGAKPKIKEKPEVKVKPFDPNENPSGSNVVDSDTTYYNTMMLSTKVRKESLRDYIDAAEQKQELGKQYRRLTKGKAHPWKAAEENMAKNRYKGILAYDHSRVVLERDCTDDSDYINANYIPGFGREKAFIAAQGAIEQNINDYWRMIWQEQVSTIVIVTKLEENRKMKSLQYWPNKNQHMTYGSVYVTLLEESTHFQYVTRKLRAKKGAEERIVSQFHFLGWPDHGVPESPTTLVNFWHVVRSHTQQEQDNAPVLVHCSAGIGRTGTYISLDCLLDEAAAGDHVDILACVNKLRTHRVDMVQTVSQYKFLYHAVYEGIYVKNTLLDTNHFRAEHHLQNTRIEQQLKVLDEQKPFSADTEAADERGDEDSDWDIQVFKVQGQGPRAMEIKHPKGSNLIFSEPPVTATSQHFWNMLQVYRTATVVMPKSKAKRSAWLPSAGKPLELPYDVSVRLQSSSDRTHIVIQQGATQPVTSAPSEESGVYMNVGEHAAEESAYMNTEEARKEAASEPVQTSQIQLITMETADADAIVNAWKRMEREKNHVIVSRDSGGDLGLFAVSCVLLDVMAEFGQVDVFSTVRQLRPHFVPDQTQYSALHNVLSYYCQHEGNSSSCEP